MSKNTSRTNIDPKNANAAASRAGLRTLRGAAAVGATGAVIAGAAFGATAASAHPGEEAHPGRTHAAGAATTATQIGDGKIELASTAVAESGVQLEEKLAAAIDRLEERAEAALATALEDGALDIGPLSALVEGDRVDVPELPADAAAIVADIEAEPLVSADGAVAIDFASGHVTVDLQTLVDARGLPADATLSDAAVIEAVQADVDEILAGLADRIDEQLLAEAQGAVEELPAAVTSQLEGVLSQATDEVETAVDAAVSEAVAPAAEELGTAADQLGSLIEVSVAAGGEATVVVDLPGDVVELVG